MKSIRLLTGFVLILLAQSTLACTSCWWPSKISWLGNSYQYPANGSVSAADNLWINAETYPIDTPNGWVEVHYTTDGANWNSVEMNKNGTTGNNQKWNINLGTFATSTTITYFVKAIDSGYPTYRYLYDNNDGDNYATTVGGGNSGGKTRTVVFMYGQTQVGQDMYLRGGIDWTYGGCSDSNKWDCAIPITHNLFADDPKRYNDKYLDWYGAEANQGDVKGSPLVWTTNDWPSSWGTTRTVANDGYGYDPENTFGMHYWKLDVDMDCSKTADGWFELKTYISNGPGWESNIDQWGTPYQSNNHFAQCGKLNVFRRGENNAIIQDL